MTMIRTLADEVFDELPALMQAYPAGLNTALLAEHFGADAANVRRVMVQLAVDGRADLRRRMDSREQFIIPWKYRGVAGLRYCPSCEKFFQLRPKRKESGYTSFDDRHCCCRKCAVAWSWTRPGVAASRTAAIRAERTTPRAKARAAEFNRMRWARPGERERLSEWNKRRWADPVVKAELSRAIAVVQRSPEMRALYSEIRKKRWSEKEFRDRMIAGIRRSKQTPEARAKFSALLLARWQDPTWRKKWLRAVRRNAALATAANRGRKQSAEHVSARVQSRERSRSMGEG